MTVRTALLMAIIVMGPVKPGQVVLEKIYEIYGPPGGSFGSALEVAVDDGGGLFVLDKMNRKIYEFDSMGAPTPALDLLPADATIRFPMDIGVSGNRLYVLDVGDLYVRDPENGSLSRVGSAGGVIAGSLCVSPEGIVVAGVKKGSEDCLHLLDHAGNVVASFGGRFDVPSEVLISLPKDFDPGILTGPMGAYYSGPAGEFYLVNPWRYEIRVYRGRQMSASLTHDASYGNYAGGARHSSLTGSSLGFSAGFIGGAAVIRSGDVILVFRVKMTGRVDDGFCVDIFRDYKYQSTQDLDIKGLPAASDGEGHIYVTEWRRNGASIAKMKLTVNWPSR